MSFVSLKHEGVFSVTNEYGDIDNENIGAGLYCKDTRFLKNYKLRLNGTVPVVLFTGREKGVHNIFMLSNGDIHSADAHYEKMDLEINRSQMIYNQTFYDHVEIINGSLKQISISLTFELEASFEDLFEVRGAKRARRGQVKPVVVELDHLHHSYLGLDDITRSLKVIASEGASLREGRISYEITLKPGDRRIITIALQPTVGMDQVRLIPYGEAKILAEKEIQDWLCENTKITTDNTSYNKTLEQAAIDLYMLNTDVGHGDFPVAGIPWFCVPFGRDSIIAAIQTLILRPDLAKNTLRTLAAFQGVEEKVWSDEAPGKILHEMRAGEMANLDEIPFKRYYGSIDSTPLFLVLLSETFHWTGDINFLLEMMPYAEKALSYLEKYADLDGDKFIEYHKQSGGGLDVQSWKDSKDSMVHADGTPSYSPMVVVEVQGYLYDAKVRMSELYQFLNHAEKAELLRRQAEDLKQRFNEVFWMKDKDYIALALDRDKNQVTTTTSDPGHCLWSGIISDEKSRTVVDALFGDGLFSGWGIRTMSKHEKVYSPLSYHNGTVWPHDNSLIALGLARYGFKGHVSRLVTSLFDAAEQFENHRLPELFCSYDRAMSALIPYPVACSPQAWAAGTPFACIQALLGIQIDGIKKEVRFNPILPEGVNRLSVEGLQIGLGRIDIIVNRMTDRTSLEEGKNTSDYRVINCSA